MSLLWTMGNSQLPREVSSVSENASVSLIRALQEQFSSEFVRINQKIGEQFMSMREEIDGKLGDIENDILKLKRESHNSWEQDPQVVRGTNINNVPSYPVSFRINRDNVREN